MSAICRAWALIARAAQAVEEVRYNANDHNDHRNAAAILSRSPNQNLSRENIARAHELQVCLCP